MKIKKLLQYAGVAGLCLAVAGCGSGDAKEAAGDVQEQVSESSADARANSEKAAQAIQTVGYSSDGTREVDCRVTLKGGDAECDGTGAVFEDGVLTIQEAGCYEITGTLQDGRIEVNASKDDKVELLFDGVEVSCGSYAPFVVWQADETLIYLEKGSENRFTDGASYETLGGTTQDDTPTAAFFSKDDLVFDGEGALTVKASSVDGISGRDDVWFENGTYEITAGDDGIVGKDSVSIKNGAFTIEAEGDGVKSTNDSDAEKGFVYIAGGTLDITSGCDGIQGETYVRAEGGNFLITTGGGSAKVTSKTGMMDRRGGVSYAEAEDSTSAKGLKAGVDITVMGGTWELDCADDALHSNDTVTISGGTLDIMTGDDGIHGDSEADIEGGAITIAGSYEGIEAETITIRGGDISVTASDDGLNAANGESAEGMDGPGGMGGQPGENSSSTGLINIEGGTLYVNADGDGVDSNGSISMSGGTVYVDGPANDGNGFLDYDGQFVISGGTFIGTGSAGMMQTASESSSQPTMAVGLGGTASAGTEVAVRDSGGNEVLSYTPSKSYAAAVISSPKLELHETYDVYVGGTKYCSFQMTSVSTSDGTVNTNGQPGGKMGGQGGGRRGNYQ